MTLIPLLSALASAPLKDTAPAGSSALLPRESYGAGNRHRPVAALLAVGLPAALVVAVALSPMIIKDPPRTEEKPWTSIFLPKPDKPEPPKPRAKPQTQPKSSQPTDTVDPRVQTPPITDIFVDRGPTVIDPPLPPGPPVSIDPPTAPPKFVTAQLDKRFAGVFQPDYPLGEERGGVEGVARVRVLIDINGRVKAVELVSTDSPGFFEATKRRALAKWRFKPATRGGVPEESWKEMTVRFEIKNA